MPRNKYPQETINRILQVSARLFVEKGYEKTSIQDIIDNLGGLTKGAIYHHFKSKEDIMLAVLEQGFKEHDENWYKILKDSQELTGLEKLREMFRASTDNPSQDGLFQSAPRMLNNPKMLTEQMRSIMEESAPEWLEPVIRQGMEDGSIKTEYPRELAEVILLLINLWVTPMVFAGTREELYRRIHFFKHLTRSLGADFMDEAMISRLCNLADLYFREEYNE